MRRDRSIWIVLAVVAAAIVAGCGESGPSTVAVVPLPARHVAGSAIVTILEIEDGGCVGSADIDRVPPDLDAFDRQIDFRGGSVGLYEAGGYRFALGSLEQAARLFGGQDLAVGSDGAWILTGPGQASELRSWTTPRGRPVWSIGNMAERDQC